MKRWGILLVFLFLASSAFAAEIQAPEKVVSYAPFTFRVVMPATDTFTQSAVHFDNILIATIYPSGTCVIQQDWIPFIIHCATFDADTKTNEGLTAVITHTGFFPGPHTIFVSTQGSSAETSLFTVNVFDAVDAASQMELSTKVDTVDTRVNALETESVAAKENIYTNNATLTKAVEEAKAELQTVQAQLAPLIAPKEEPVETGFQIPFISDFFRPSSPATGLATGSNAPIIGLGIVAAIALGFFVFNGRKKEGFNAPTKGTPFFEGTLDTLFKNVPGKTSDDRPEAQPKKWSSDVEDDLREDIENNPPERDTKIHYSDLTR